MPRIRPLAIEEAPERVRGLMAEAAQQFGRPLPTVGIQAYCPPILEASRLLGGAPARSRQLPDQLRALVCLRVAQIVGCPF